MHKAPPHNFWNLVSPELVRLQSVSTMWCLENVVQSCPVLFAMTPFSLTIQPAHRVCCHSRHLKTSLPEPLTYFHLAWLLLLLPAALPGPMLGGPFGHHPTDSLVSLSGRSPCVALTSFSFLVYPSCWSLSSSSFVKKGMWDMNFLRPCMSEDSFILPSWFGGFVAELGIQVGNIVSKKSGDIALLCCNSWYCCYNPMSSWFLITCPHRQEVFRVFSLSFYLEFFPWSMSVFLQCSGWVLTVKLLLCNFGKFSWVVFSFLFCCCSFPSKRLSWMLDFMNLFLPFLICTLPPIFICLFLLFFWVIVSIVSSQLCYYISF